MEHCDVFVAIRIAVEKDASAQRVLQAAWPDVQFIDRVADLSNNTLPQIGETSTTCSNMGRGSQHTITFVGKVFRNSKIGQLATKIGP